MISLQYLEGCALTQRRESIMVKRRKRVIVMVDPEKRPSREKRVKVLHGKHKGKIGLVTWHGPSGFGHRKHKDIWVAHAIGREGYRVKIRTQYNEEFYVDAEKVEVIS